MPYPSQIDRETIISTARHMIEAEGVENLSLRSLAHELGVKAPSLYRYVDNKTGLLRAINEETTREMVASMLQASDEQLSASEAIVAIGKAFRQFVHKNPACYMLSANTLADDTRPSADEREALVLPLQDIIAEITDNHHSLAGIRGAYAFLHGWVILELTKQFERGGDLNAHFEQALRAYLAGW